jgi:hypothetical protein
LFGGGGVLPSFQVQTSDLFYFSGLLFVVCLMVIELVIRKVRKTQHQNPEFGHTQGEIQKKPAKKYISIQRGMKLRKTSILVVN